MSLLDRYVGRTVLTSFLAGLVFFLFLTIVMDLLSNFGRYIDRAERQDWTGVELAVALLRYYLLLLPVMFVMIAPFVTVIACMFSVARLQNANELAPMLFVGRPMQRVLRPMLMCGLLAAGGMAACWQWVVPRISTSLAEFDSSLNRGSTVQKDLVDQWVKEGSTYFLYVEEYDLDAETMGGISMLVEGVLVADNVLVTAERASWDADRGDWRLEGGRRTVENGHSPAEWLGRGDLTPAVLLQRSRETVEADTLSYSELAELSELRPNRAELRLAFHRHITYPFANLILLWIVLPLAVWFERGGRIGRVMLAIGLCGAYALVDLVCQSLAQNGHLPPITAAWAPTIVFGSLGAVLFGGMKT